MFSTWNELVYLTEVLLECMMDFNVNFKVVNHVTLSW